MTTTMAMLPMVLIFTSLAELIDHLSGLGSITETLAPHPAGGEGGLDEEKQGEHGQG